MDMCIKEDIKRNLTSTINETVSVNEKELRESIQYAIKKSLNEWEDPFDETNLEDIPTWQALKNIDKELFDCSLYNEQNECVGKLYDLHFIYSPKKNKLL